MRHKQTHRAKSWRPWRFRKHEDGLSQAFKSIRFGAENAEHGVTSLTYSTCLEVMLAGGQTPCWLVEFGGKNAAGITRGALQCSRSLAGQLGHRYEDIESLSLEQCLTLVHPDDWDMICDRHQVVPATGLLRYELEVRIQVKSGEYRWFRLRGLSVFDRGVLRVAGGTLEDVHLAKEKEAALVFAASRDTLTGLGNKISLQDALHRVLAHQQDKRTPFAIVYLDINRFKAINDAHGHLFGDEVLKEVGQRIGHSLRPHDFLSRPHGDEFVAILKGVRTHSMLKQIATRLALSISKPVHVGQSTVDVSVSMGLILIDQDVGLDSDELICAADMAMYDAKRAGVAWRVGSLSYSGPR